MRDVGELTMAPEINAMMDQIQVMRRLRQWNAVYCIATGIVHELPRCHRCGVLYPCDCQDPMEYQEARETPETTGRIILHGREEVY